MKKIVDYVKEVEELTEKKIIWNKEQVKNDILINIKFYQHERLIHLIVTAFVGIIAITFFSLGMAFQNLSLIILFACMLVLFVPYIFYYYTMENSVQKLYDLYFKIK